MQIRKCSIRAFTLAEVLITLGIIGVVAAMTLNVLINNYKRVVLENQFKKAYSTLQNALLRFEEAEGPDAWLVYYDPTDKKGAELRQALYKYINGSGDKRQYKELHTYKTSARNSKTLIHNCPVSCCVPPAKDALHAVDGVMYKVCARDNVLNFAIDINGYNKGPNKWGIDLFDFDYGKDNKLKTSTIGKYYCSAYIHSKNTNVNDGMGCSFFAVSDPDYFKKIDL